MPTAQPDGYLALPAGGQGRGVMVLHAWWGLNDDTRDFCTRLAEAGFVAFAPDLYHGKVTDQIAEADILSSTLLDCRDLVRVELADAVAFLNERAGHNSAGLAVIGFSLGAFFALDLSVTVPEQIRSVVVYYGTRPGDYSNSQAAYLGHFAETDEYEAQSDVDDLEQSLKQAGRPVTFYRYPQTGHWFCEPNCVQAYNEAAANLAWERTLAFLNSSAAA